MGIVMASTSTEEPTSESNQKETDFVKVTRKSRKRKLDQNETADDMDTSEKLHSEVKRPTFPPISADKMTVCFRVLLLCKSAISCIFSCLGPKIYLFVCISLSMESIYFKSNVTGYMYITYFYCISVEAGYYQIIAIR